MRTTTQTATLARIDVKNGTQWDSSPVYHLDYTVDRISYESALRRAQSSGREFRVISR